MLSASTPQARAPGPQQRSSERPLGGSTAAGAECCRYRWDAPRTTASRGSDVPDLAVRKGEGRPPGHPRTCCAWPGRGSRRDESGRDTGIRLHPPGRVPPFAIVGLQLVSPRWGVDKAHPLAGVGGRSVRRKGSKPSGSGIREPRNRTCLPGALPGRADSDMEREAWGAASGPGPKFPPEAPSNPGASLQQPLVGPSAGPARVFYVAENLGTRCPVTERNKVDAVNQTFRVVLGCRDASGKHLPPEPRRPRPFPTPGRWTTVRPTPRRRATWTPRSRPLRPDRRRSGAPRGHAALR